MRVFAQTVAVPVAAVEPPQRPAGQLVIGFGLHGAGQGHALAHLVQRPAVDGRLAEIVHHFGIVDAVRQAARGALVVEQQHELVPGEGRVPLRKRDGVKAVVPAVDVAHPVFGHVHRLPLEETARVHQAAPVDIGGQAGGRGQRRGDLRHGAAEILERALHAGAGGVKVPGAAPGPVAADLLGREQELPAVRLDGQAGVVRAADVPGPVDAHPAAPRTVRR